MLLTSSSQDLLLLKTTTALHASSWALLLVAVAAATTYHWPAQLTRDLTLLYSEGMPFESCNLWACVINEIEHEGQTFNTKISLIRSQYGNCSTNYNTSIDKSHLQIV